MNAEYKASLLSLLEVNLVHITIGEKNFIDSLVSFPPQGRSCMKSVFSHHVVDFRKSSGKYLKPCMNRTSTSFGITQYLPPHTSDQVALSPCNTYPCSHFDK